MAIGWRVFFKNGAIADFWECLSRERVEQLCKRDFENEIKEIIRLK